FVTVSDPAIRQLTLDELLAASDYVVCLAIANEQTEDLIGAAALGRMQRHPVFINPSRGNLVYEAALAPAFRQNHIAPAAPDGGRARGQVPPPARARRRSVGAKREVGARTRVAVECGPPASARPVRAVSNGACRSGFSNTGRWTSAPSMGDWSVDSLRSA